MTTRFTAKCSKCTAAFAGYFAAWDEFVKALFRAGWEHDGNEWTCKECAKK